MKMLMILPQSIIFCDLLVKGAENISRPNKSDEKVFNICMSMADNNVQIDDSVRDFETHLENDGFVAISDTKIFMANKILITIGKIKNILLNNNK
jgi:hypothetical protein